MAAVTVAERMTAEEFLALPVPRSGRPWNLVEGEVVVNEPTPLHQLVVRNVFRALDDWTRKVDGRGEVTLPLDVALDDRNVFAPDLLWYAHGRAPGPDARPPSPLPDLVVEVRSASTWRYDIGAKNAGYERAGLPELWLVDTAAGAVLAFRRSAPTTRRFDRALELGAGERLTSPLLPGFGVDVDNLFPSRG